MKTLPSTQTGLTRGQADARYPLLIDVSAVAAPDTIPLSDINGYLNVSGLNAGGTGVSLVNLSNYAGANLLEMHTANATGMKGYAHSNTGFRAFALDFMRSGGTYDAPTAVTSGMTLGYTSFGGYDGTAYQSPSVQWQAYATQNWSSTARGGALEFSTTPNDATSQTPRLTIDHDGRLKFGGRYIQPYTNSTTAIQIANAAGTPFVTFDSTNLRMSATAIENTPIGGTTPAAGTFTIGSFTRTTPGAALTVTPAASEIGLLINNNGYIAWTGNGYLRKHTAAWQFYDASFGSMLVFDANNFTYRNDTDATTILGRWRFDSRSSDIAYAGHYDFTTGANYAFAQNNSGRTYINSASGQPLLLNIAGTPYLTIDANGRTLVNPGNSNTGFMVAPTGTSTINGTYVYIKSPGGSTNAVVIDGGTSQVLPLLLFRDSAGTPMWNVSNAGYFNLDTNLTNSQGFFSYSHNTSGTPTTNFGVGHRFFSESSTTVDRELGRFKWSWSDATDASRLGRLIISVFNIGSEVDVLTLTPTGMSSTLTLTNPTSPVGLGLNLTANGVGTAVTGLSLFTVSNPTSGTPGNVSAINAFAYHGTSATVANTNAVYGIRGQALNDSLSSNPLATAIAIEGLINSARSGAVITEAAAFRAGALVNTGATIGTFYGVRVIDPTGGGTITTNYGLKIENQTKGGTNYAIYTDAGLVRFGGNVSVGTGSVLTVPDGAGTSVTPQFAVTPTSGSGAVSAQVIDGTNNRRSALFVDNTNALWGLSHTYSSSPAPFVIRVASNEFLRIDTSGNLSVGSDADRTTILGRARIDSRTSDALYISHFDRTLSTDYALYQSNNGTTILNAASGQSLAFRINNSSLAAISSSGMRVGDGNAPVFTLDVRGNAGVTQSTSGTSSPQNPLTLSHNSTGTPVNGFGTALRFLAETSTTEDTELGRLKYVWATVTHASRVSNAIISVYNVGVETDVLTLTPTAANFAVSLGGTSGSNPLTIANASATQDVNVLSLFHNKTGAGNDVSGLSFDLNNDAATRIVYGRIQLLNTGATATAEDGTFIHEVRKAGALVEFMRVRGSQGVIFNELGNDQDFRVEGDTDANAFVLDASSNRVGLGIAVPLRRLHVNDDGILIGSAESGTDYIRLLASNGSGEPELTLFNTGAVDAKFTSGNLTRASGGGMKVNVSFESAGALIASSGLASQSSSAAVGGAGTLMLRSTNATAPFIKFTELGATHRGAIGFPAGSGTMTFELGGTEATFGGGTTALALTTTTAVLGTAGASAARFNINPSVSQVGVIVRAPSSGTANLQEWQDNSGTSLVAVKSDGNMLAPLGWQIQWGDALFHISRPAGLGSFRVTSNTSGSILELHNGSGVIGFWRGDGRLHLSNGGSLEWNDPSDSISTANGSSRMIFSKYPTASGGWTFRTSLSVDVLDMSYLGVATHTLTSTGTNGLQTAFTFRQNGGSVATGFGSTYLFQLESSTTENQNAAAIDVSWAEATHASRVGQMIFNVYNISTKTEIARLTPTGMGIKTTPIAGNAVLQLPNALYLGFKDAAGTGLAAYAYADSSNRYLLHTHGYGTAIRIDGTTIELNANGGSGNIVFGDARNLQVGTSTGTKIGTSTSQKIGFWNAVPVVQPTASISAAAFLAGTSGIADDSATYGGYTLGQVVAALIQIGILA